MERSAYRCGERLLHFSPSLSVWFWSLSPSTESGVLLSLFKQLPNGL